MKSKFVWLATKEYDKNNPEKNIPEKLIGIEFEIKQDASDFARRENKKNKSGYVVLKKSRT